jgi:hypothetical protein
VLAKTVDDVIEVYFNEALSAKLLINRDRRDLHGYVEMLSVTE